MQRRWQLAVLVTLNLVVQLFDGVATYIGWERHGEMNPILSAGFEQIGAGPTLLIAKSLAIALVLVIAMTPRRSLATLGLALTLTAYTAFSFLPWSQRLFG
jgi:hypothetical protein